ncbi:MAG: flavin reductase family protein [Pseudomonadota bacterium]
MTDSLLELRQTLGKFATGITVVTCCAADGRACGITANSFSSVSLDPPLVLWNIAKSSNSLQAYLEATHFAIHVLNDQQEAISRHFAKTDHKAFDRIQYRMSDEQVPILEAGLARLDCRTERVIDAGDHHIIIGEVLRHEAYDGAPLMYYNGNYARF